jgi:hypothetical protein
MGKIRVSKIIYAGWLAPEYNLYSFFSEKRKTKASEGLEVVQKEIFKTIDNLLAGIKIKEIEDEHEKEILQAKDRGNRNGNQPVCDAVKQNNAEIWR